MFHVLNVISGFLEVGSVLFGMKHFGIAGALAGALCYQIGNIVPNPFGISKRLCISFLLLAALGMVFGIVCPIFVLAAMPFLTMVLQSVRGGYKNAALSEERNSLQTTILYNAKPDRNKEVKRFVRILGFAVGFGLNAFTGLVCTILVFLETVRRQTDEEIEFEWPHFNRFDWILVLHEMHYFVYCYSMVIYVYVHRGIVIAAIAFFISWLLYVFAPRIYAKLDYKLNNYRLTFLIGHSVLTLLLVLLFIVPTFEGKIMVWFLTGIGGTTEYCIGRLEKQYGNYAKHNHNCAENLGHILGVLTCILIYGLSHSLLVSILAAIMFSMSALGIMFYIMRRESSYESM